MCFVNIALIKGLILKQRCKIQKSYCKRQPHKLVIRRYLTNAKLYTVYCIEEQKHVISKLVATKRFLLDEWFQLTKCRFENSNFFFSGREQYKIIHVITERNSKLIDRIFLNSESDRELFKWWVVISKAGVWSMIPSPCLLLYKASLSY